MNDTLLAQKKCIPCSGELPVMSRFDAEKFLPQLGANWEVCDHGYLYLCKVFKYPNFVTAMDFANKIADIAEQENHHPSLYISWGSCIVEIWTHAINGLTESDFILAAKIEELAKN